MTTRTTTRGDFNNQRDILSRNPPAGNDKNGFALAAQSGQSQGRPSTNATSQVKV